MDNFPSYLKEVPNASSFAFDRLTGFVTSSRDSVRPQVSSINGSGRSRLSLQELLRLANIHDCKFAGSTSSLTGMLSLIYLLIAEERPVDVSTLSAHYQNEVLPIVTHTLPLVHLSRYVQPKSFTPGQRMPVSVTLRYKDGVYATDSHVEHLVQLGSTETVLSQLVSRDGHVPSRMFSRCTPSGNSDGEVLHDAVRQI